MKYFRLLELDFKCSIGIALRFFLCLIGIFCPCLGYGATVERKISLGLLENKGTVMNVLAYFFVGTKYMKPTMEATMMELPLRWCIIYIAGLSLIADFPFRMRTLAGNAQILALRSQWGWWFVKLAWSMLILAAYAAVFALTVLGYCVWKGIPITLEIDPEVFLLLHLYGPESPLPAGFWPFRLIGAPLLLLVVLALFQMMLSQILGPLGGFFVTVSQLAAAMVYPSVFLIGNQGMVLRDSRMTEAGVDSGAGMLFLLIVGAVSFLLWNLLTWRKESLPKEREEV